MNRQLEHVFRECFYTAFCTRLTGGASEPLYQPGRGEGGAGELFVRAVAVQAQQYCREGLPPQAEQFRRVPAQQFGGDPRPPAACFQAGSLA